MDAPPGTIARAREFVLVSLAGLLLAIVMTWPLAGGMGRLGRTTGADGQFSIWNIAWVARTIVVDPLHLFDANIFYPHKTTLAYSEANILEGSMAVPVYWLTGNPYAALNFVVLLSFASSFACAYSLFRHLTRDRPASAIAGVLFACCPYVFAHTSHIQLLQTFGIPLSMLMLHRVADEPTLRRGVGLGAALVAQAMSCAYYGIFAGLMVGYGALVLAASRRLWRSRDYWIALACGAATSILVVLPFFLPYLRVQDENGFARTLADAVRWSARLQEYLVSSAHAHAWLLEIAARFDRWTEVLFPGMLAIVFGVAGIAVVATSRGPARDRETGALYGSLGLLALWASFGPAAGLYRILFHLPLFSFLRAPSRFGLVVVFCLAVFAAFGLRRLLAAVRWRSEVAWLLAALAVLELNVLPFPWERAPITPTPYATLAKLPRGVVAEFPFYGERIAFPLHAQYMLFSAAHWMPLVNGYSDVIPLDFREAAAVLDGFPSRDAFAMLARRRVRYLAVHWDMYVHRRDEIRQRLEPFTRFLRVLAEDDRMTLYEVVSYP